MKSLALLLQQDSLMLRIEHRLMAVVAAAMAGDLLASVQDANHSVGCDEGQLAPNRFGGME